MKTTARLRQFAPVATVAVVALLVPLLASGYWVYVVTLGLVYAIVAMSLVVLTGWIGQVSLAQASFMGISAYLLTSIEHHWGLPFALAAAIAVAATIPLTVVIGAVALRLSGFLLAAATIAFSLAVSRFVFQIEQLTGGNAGFRAPRPALFAWEASGDGLYFLVAACAAGLFVVLHNLRRSRLGRAWTAIRTSEPAASSLGIDVTRSKLVGFITSGLVAGIGGVLYASLLGRLSVVSFDAGTSIIVAAIALVGGVRYLTGALVGGLAYAFLPEITRALKISGNWVPLIVAVSLMVAIAFAPRGVVGLFGRRHDAGDDAEAADLDLVALDELATLWGERPATAPLRMENVTVRFGGVTALDRVSLDVPPGRVIGLIGPNGAGKSTCFKVLTGFVPPAEGEVWLGDQRITRTGPATRARLGLTQTFQTPLLFSSETVVGNLLIAAHTHTRSGFVRSVLGTGQVRAEEAVVEAEARVILRALGLSAVADTPVASLPFGMERLVEIARALMVRPSILLLDEPAAGLSHEETVRLGRLVGALTTRLGLSVLLIEHDVELVMTVANHIHVLDFGHHIAAGDPATIQDDPTVHRAYLGVDDDPALADEVEKSGDSTTLVVAEVTNHA